MNTLKILGKALQQKLIILTIITVIGMQYLHSPTERRLKFKCITENETTKVINSLENKTSSGHDGISIKLLKLIQDME